MILQSIEALNAAELKFQDIINSPTVDAACRKIDHLAEKNQLDSALVMMITKAWSAAKELSMTKDEVKDVLYHCYVTARGNLQRFTPKEIRILIFSQLRILRSLWLPYTIHLPQERNLKGRMLITFSRPPRSFTPG
ncbi:unnamed protein product [Malus baccata var. baccata]